MIHQQKKMFATLVCLVLGGVLLLGTQASFAQKKRLSKDATPKIDPLVVEKDVYQIVRLRDTLSHSDGTMFKLGMYVRPIDSVLYKTRQAMMVIFNSREGRHIVYRDAGRRLENNWYAGRVFALMKPAIRRTGTATESTGIFEQPHPIPEAWTVPIFKYLFYGKISPQRLIVRDSLVMAAPGYQQTDSTFFFIRIYDNGTRYEHRFRASAGGFVIDPQALAKTLGRTAQGEMPSGEVVFLRQDKTEELIAGVTLVFPDVESINKELGLIANAMQTEEDLPAKERNKRRETAEQKKVRIRQELYEHLQTLYGSVDNVAFKKFLEPFKL
jgi:hypothetical protein